VNTLIHRRCVRNILWSASPMLMQYRDSLGDHFAGLTISTRRQTGQRRNQIGPSLGIAPNPRPHQGIPTPFGAVVGRLFL
jgi:hypothetical protein